MRSSLIDLFVLVGFSIGANAGITFTACNTAATDTLNQAIKDAAAMAKNALDGLNDKPMTAVTSALWAPLFLPKDLSFVKGVFTELAAVQETTLEITIFCSEDHIRLKDNQPTNNNYWYDFAFTDPSGKYKNFGIPQGFGKNDQANPRAKPGSLGSYTTLGQSQNGLDLTNQRHIYFDPRAYGPSSTNIDRRSLKTIITDNLDPSYGGKLENIRPIEVTMLHELSHAVMGLLNPSSGTGSMLINDGPPPFKDTYGWTKCMKLRESQTTTVVNIQYQPQRAADCYVQFALGLTLQIGGKDTFWTKGVIDPKTLTFPQ